MTYAPLQVARTGLDAQSQRMRVIANNLANVNTTGFKRDRADFETLAYQQVTAAGATSAGDNRYATGLNLGSGTRVAGTSRIMAAGTLNTTDNPLDLAIEGDGFFSVARPDGTSGYTRAGAFQLSNEGKLVTSDGQAIQPEISIPEGATGITIGLDGTVTATLAGEAAGSEVGKIEISRFANPAGLQSLGGNLYAETAASGSAQTGAAGSEGRGSIRQGALEGSNVNIVQELVDMIETQRAYEVNSKMISATDEMLKKRESTDVIGAILTLMMQAATPANGAIFQPSRGYVPLTSGHRAGSVGDVLTVALVERTVGSTTATTGTDRNGSIGLTPPTTGPLALFSASDASLGANSQFAGRGASSQANALSGEITVTVVEVTPAGMLRIEGTKQLRINRGNETVRVSGLIRPTDIGADNRVPSTRIADARIDYTGRGEVARASRQGWLQRFFSMISPF